MNDEARLDMRSHNETQTHRHSVVMLGASNLSRAFPMTVSMAQRVIDAPIAFYVAKGHGRSYGQDSSCLGKKFPGIFSCGIWSAIAQEKSVPITAFMTDIGNDLAYEVPVEQVLSWVEECLERLSALGARVIMTDLPLDALRGVGELRYRLFRTLLFPQCRLDWPEMLRRAERLSEALHALADSREIPVFEAPKQYYGLDPIHPRKGHYPAIWSQLWSLAGREVSDDARQRCSLSLSWYLRRRQAAQWSMFGRARRTSQPDGRLLTEQRSRSTEF